MDKEKFSQRLVQLRENRGISARDMSLSLGQNPGYINAIENQKALPTMSNFFYICEFFNITPSDFFDDSVENPEKLHLLTKDLASLNEKQLNAIATLVEGILKK